MSRFTAEPYRAEGGFSVTGLPVLLVIMVAVAGAMGWLASFVRQWFYLVLVFPAAIGLVLFFTGMSAGKLTRMRSPLMAGLIAVVASAVAMTAMHYFDYQRFLKQNEKDLEAIGQVDPEARRRLEGPGGFVNYMEARARAGVRIGKGGGGMNLGYAGSWIYWGVELVVVAALAMTGMVMGSRCPFCPACDSWKEVRRLGTVTGKPGDVAALLKEGDLDRLQEHSPARGGGDVFVHAAVCPRCGDSAPIHVRLLRYQQTKDGNQEVELAHVTYPGEVLRELEAMFSGPATSEPEAITPAGSPPAPPGPPPA